MAFPSDDREQIPPARWALWFAMSFFVVLQVTHAWLVDDAYITLRTVDNFVHGLGLRWNPEERVQSYTHPLWMFALSAVYGVTGEAFYSTLALAFVTTLLAILVVLRCRELRGDPHRPVLFMVALLGSKAFLDYSSSGLENPLTHLILGLFCVRWLRGAGGASAEGRPRLLLGLASLAFVNRMDTVLFYAPACALMAYEARRALGPVLRAAAWAAVPAVAWVAFSLFYYGTVVPNTAIAKLSGPRVTRGEQLQAGVAYLADSAMTDPLTLTICALALTAAFASRRPRFVAVASGMLLYLVYVGTTGAIGTHMSGRFLSAPLFVAALLLAYLAEHWLVALGGAGVVALWMAASPVSPLRVGFDSYASPSANRGRGVIIDTRRFVVDEGGALLNLVPGEAMPRHWWYLAGRDYRAKSQRVHLGGLGEALAVGYSGFAAGPTHHIIDPLGLCDPLIARLPLTLDGGQFRPGHFFRELPPGYVDTLERGQNRIQDLDLATYYDAIRVITRDPLFSWKRIETLVAFNLGRYDRYLDAYARRNGLRAR